MEAVEKDIKDIKTGVRILAAVLAGGLNPRAVNNRREWEASLHSRFTPTMRLQDDALLDIGQHHASKNAVPLTAVAKCQLSL